MLVRIALSLSILLAALSLPAEAKEQTEPQADTPTVGGKATDDEAYFGRKPEFLKKTGITEHVGDKIPLDLTFVDSSGETVKLGNYFSGGQKPVVINLGYYSCPMLCGRVMNALKDAAGRIDYTPGQEYEIVTISIDPRESARLAFNKKRSYIQALGKPGADAGWHFMVSPDDNVRQLADAVGFNYAWDEKSEQYSHPALIVICTPDGRVSRYLYGMDYKDNLKLSLVEASEGKLQTVSNQILLYCYSFDPSSGSYVLQAMNVMRLGGAITVVLMVLIIGILLFREWVRRSRARERQAEAGAAAT